MKAPSAAHPGVVVYACVSILRLLDLQALRAEPAFAIAGCVHSAGTTFACGWTLGVSGWLAFLLCSPVWVAFSECAVAQLSELEELRTSSLQHSTWPSCISGPAGNIFARNEPICAFYVLRTRMCVHCKLSKQKWASWSRVLLAVSLAADAVRLRASWKSECLPPCAGRFRFFVLSSEPAQVGANAHYFWACLWPRALQDVLTDPCRPPRGR